MHRRIVELTPAQVQEVILEGIEHHDTAHGTNHPIGGRHPYHHHIDGKAGEKAHEILTNIPRRKERGVDPGWDAVVPGWGRTDIKVRPWQRPDVVFMVPTRQMDKHKRTEAYGFFRRIGAVELRDRHVGEGAKFEWFGYITREKLVALDDITNRYGERAYCCRPDDLSEYQPHAPSATGLTSRDGHQSGGQRRAPTAGEKRRAMNASQLSLWSRAKDGCSKPGCKPGVATFQYNSPFTLVRCDDCPHR